MRMITSFPSSTNWTACIWTIGSHLLTTQRNKRTNQVGNDSQRRGHVETWLTSRGDDAHQFLLASESHTVALICKKANDSLGALQSNRAAFEVVAMERKDLSEC